jgi:hypothetical protein
MPLHFDHVPFSKPNGPHEFGPRDIADKAWALTITTLQAQGTAVAVPSGQGGTFPVAPFMATLDDDAGQVESVRVGARAGDIFTVTRERPERVWPVGTRFQVRTTIVVRFGRCTLAKPHLWPHLTFVVNAAAAAGATQLSVEDIAPGSPGLWANIPAGTVYTQGGASLTLSAEAVQGSHVIQVAPLPQAIPADTLVRGVEAAAAIYLSVNGRPREEAGGFVRIAPDALDLFNAGTSIADLIESGKLKFGASGGRRVVRGADFIEHAMGGPLAPGINRVLTGLAAVRGGQWDTELSLETF